MEGIILMILGTLLIIATRVIVKSDLRKIQATTINESLCLGCKFWNSLQCIIERHEIERKIINLEEKFRKRFLERLLCYLSGVLLIEFGLFQMFVVFVPELSQKEVWSLVLFINAAVFYVWSLTLRKKSPETDAHPFGILLMVYAGLFAALSIILQV